MTAHNTLSVTGGGGPVPDPAFCERVYHLVALVPPGRVVTYGQIAHHLGAPRSAQMVGRALSRLPANRPVPWHRVINQSGRISARWPAARMDYQAQLLRDEGIVWEADGRIDLGRYRWQFPNL